MCEEPKWQGKVITTLRRKISHLSVKLYTEVTLASHMTKYESYLEVRVTSVYSFTDK